MSASSLFVAKQLTLREILSTLSTSSTSSPSSPDTNGSISPRKTNSRTPITPYIDPKSDHYKYALLIVAGMPHEDACTMLEVNPRTAERWRRDLRKSASAFFGRRIEYSFAALYATNREIQLLCADLRIGRGASSSATNDSDNAVRTKIGA